MSGTFTVGYLPKSFSRTSETVIINEIVTLERLGLDIRIYPLKRPQGAARQSTAPLVRASMRYLPEKIVLSLPWLLPVHLGVALARPRGYARALRYSVTRCLRQRSTSTLGRFFQAGFLVGWTLRGARIRHFHAHSCHGPATVALFVKWMKGIPYSFTAHARDLYRTEPDILRDKMREAEFVMTCTSHNRDYLQQVGGELAPVHRIYHGLDLSRFTRTNSRRIVPLTVAAATRGPAPFVLAVGRLVEKKGLDTLVRACALLRDRGLRFRCLIYGDGRKRAELEALVRSLALEGTVELPGALLQDDRVELYRQATLFALPCQVLDNGDRDGLPDVLVEAMAMELPVVSTAVSGIPELIQDGVNGYLVPPRSPELLADRMRALLEDPALRRRMGREGRRRVRAEFDLERNSRRVLALFQSALGLHSLDTEAANVQPVSSEQARQDGSI